MPYHRQALGQNWDQIDKGQQALIIGSMRVISGGLLGANLGIMVMLLIPFRSGEMWSYYAIPAIGLITSLPILYGLLIVRLRTRARPPVAVTAAGCALIIIGLVLSLF